MSPGLREMRWPLESEADFRLDLPCAEMEEVPKMARINKGSIASSWSISKSEGKSKDHPTPRQGTSCLCHAHPGSHTPYLAERVRLAYLVPGPLSPALICSWSLLGPCPEGRSHRPPESQEGAGGGSLPGGVLKAIWGGSRTHCVC